ncbi:unnamed protein product, partial [Closterium sp. NIES-53]
SEAHAALPCSHRDPAAAAEAEASGYKEGGLVRCSYQSPFTGGDWTEQGQGVTILSFSVPPFSPFATYAPHPS